MRSHKAACILAALGHIISFALLPKAWAIAPHRIAPLLIIDRYSLFFFGLILIGSFVITVLSYSYLAKHNEEKEEYYLLLLLATLGSMTLASSAHFISFFLGLEILSVSLFILIAYLTAFRKPLEAALKYLVLAGASSAFLVFGMALVYADSGTMQFTGIGSYAMHDSNLLLTGVALMLTGIGFKLALVPFHMWTPDVYQGAPAPVAGFIASVSKGAMFAAFLRFLFQAHLFGNHSLMIAIVVVAAASMAAGNILALMQNNVKRILAYSSISHLGYLLIALFNSKGGAEMSSSFYLVAYFAAILTAFGVISVLSTVEGDLETLDELKGLFWRRPWLALALSTALFSLAGIPLTAGFIGKVYLLFAGIGSGWWFLVIMLIVTSAIGIYYYLRVIVSMYSAAPIGEKSPSEGSPVPWTSRIILACLTASIIWLGIFPDSLMRLIHSASL
jgi:NADH-quinone oxidoreductase subunit N